MRKLVAVPVAIVASLLVGVVLFPFALSWASKAVDIDIFPERIM